MSDQTSARREQLERLKDQRRAARQGGSRRLARAERAPATPTYMQLLAEIRRIAMAGVMPTPARFDLAKPATWAVAGEQCARFGLSWEQLAGEAGLAIKRAQTRMGMANSRRIGEGHEKDITV